jgi:predicted phosphodiesterase
MGERQVLEAVEHARGMDLVLVLMHHPLYWLADFDKAAVEPLLASHADVVLHGHVHRPSELSSRCWYHWWISESGRGGCI